MTNPDAWQKNNDAYLAAALKWLRIKLTAMGGKDSGLPVPLKSAQPTKLPAGCLSGSKRKTAQSSDDDRTKEFNSIAADEQQARNEMTTAENSDPPPALVILGRRLGLSRFERNVLLLCAAVELDTRISILCARAQDDPNRSFPTFVLSMALFDDPAWDALSPERPLRYLRLIEIVQPGAMPLTSSPLRADERIVSYLKGLNYLDDRLAQLLTPIEEGDGALPPSQLGITKQILGLMQVTSATGRFPVIQLTGLDSGSKQLIAGRVCSSIGLRLYRLPVDGLPQPPSELETFIRLWERDSLLLPVALYLDARDADVSSSDGAGRKPTPLGRFIGRSSGLLFLDTRDIWPGLEETVPFDIITPTPAEQLEAWRETLGAGSDGIAKLLAGQFNLNVSAIRRVGRSTLAETAENGTSVHDRAWKLCLLATRPGLESLARRIEPRSCWDDIVLFDEAAVLLRKIAGQVRQRMKVYEEWGFSRKMSRGLGINALFAGESGTGKTMAAEVIANDLGLDLYRIDLSAVVSKYIGETEKNLRRLFDAAEDGGAILFFDEADALFGKRSEVKDSHDRYANIEINYLLQRMESYRGLAILATNMKSSLDQAFLRRLRFIVSFQYPGVAERKLIWQKVFPAATPTDNLNIDSLARLNLTGGAISNIALNAAFLAAGNGAGRVTMPLLIDAIRTEFRKLEKPVNEAEFRAMAGVGATQ